MIGGTIRVCVNVAELVREAAGHIVSTLQEAIRLSGSASFVLSGGATPRSVYDLLGSEEFRDRIEWPKVHIFWGDERCVPPGHPESNFRMANESLIRRIAIPAANVHRIPAERPPQEAARMYQSEIRRVLQLREQERPRFSLVLLGLGEDGHTASLFPRTQALQERLRLVTEVYVESVNGSRVTLTLPAINNARQVVFLVTGKQKARILQAIAATDVPEYPANLIRPASGSLLWMVDADAASQLTLPAQS
jgi:6-phosphogluconolactonase